MACSCNDRAWNRGPEDSDRSYLVVNEGAQAHEVVLVKLAPAAKAQDFIPAFESGAVEPPPGRPLGASSGLNEEPGASSRRSSIQAGMP